MKKLLFITPHLSTGGLPQFLLKKIQALNDYYEIHCIEYNDHTGGVLVVQKEQIQKLCNNRFYVLGENKHDVLKLIDKINPDIIALEEMPEYFMDFSISSQIYNESRRYFIVETSHDSSFNPNNKMVYPDHFTFVSKFQENNVKSLPVKSKVIEYPVEVKIRQNREVGLQKLGLDFKKRHVLHVGLFTPRKNQKEFIEYARSMENENIQFHCVGNMADNFKFYWEPLLIDLPKNVKVWGERKDVHNFYSCMDLFLFTSRGHINDKETAPIVIKEAISYNIPSLFYNLPVYLDRYSCYENVKYLNETSFDDNINLIRDTICSSKSSLNVDDKDFIAVISTHPNYDAVEETTIKSITQIKKAGYKVILTSHYPVSTKLQSLVDHCIYDSNNPSLTHNFYKTWSYINQYHDIKVYLPSCGSDAYHGLGVALNYYNGISLANKLGYKNVFAFNYDVVISEKDFNNLDVIKNIMQTKKGFFFYDKALEGDTLKTVFHAINTEFYLNLFEYFTPNTYEKFVKDMNISNGLEQFYYNRFINKKKDLYIDYKNNEESFFKNSELNMFSMCEYLAVLPIPNQNKFVCLSNFNNKIDNKINEICVYENDILIKREFKQITKSGWWHIEVDFIPNCQYKVLNTIFDKDKSSIIREISSEFSSIDELKNNGHFIAK
jgi:glycosyltransferase involved in cell wall biosynthesis